LLAQHYRKLVQVLDYLLSFHCSKSGVIQWSYSSCCPDVIFFMDGNPWKMARPGRRDAATALVGVAGGDDVNLVQQAYYNGHYGFVRAKAHAANGMCYSFT
jgi:hypothetical protein